MIEFLRKHIELDDAVPLNRDVYLGCKQEDIAPPFGPDAIEIRSLHQCHKRHDD